MKNDKKDAEKYNYPEPKEEITQEQLRDYTVEVRLVGPFPIKWNRQKILASFQLYHSFFFLQFFALRNAKSIRAGAKGADNEGLEKGIADLNELIQATEKFKLEHAGKKVLRFWT